MNRILVLCLFVFTFCLPVFSGERENDFSVNILFDTSLSMQEDGISGIAISNLAGELNDLDDQIPEGTRFTVTTFKQGKENPIVETVKDLFVYKFGQDGDKNLLGLTEDNVEIPLLSRRSVASESDINSLVNSEKIVNLEKQKTIVLVITNSQKIVSDSDLERINDHAKEYASRLLVCYLPRAKEFKDTDARKAEIAKRISESMSEIEKILKVQNFSFNLKVCIDGKEYLDDFALEAKLPIAFSIKIEQREAQESRVTINGKIVDNFENIIVNEPGTFTVSASAKDYLDKSHEKQIQFKVSKIAPPPPIQKKNVPMPEAIFDFETNENDVFEIRFTNKSKNAKSFLWTFGDGTESKDENPTHNYERVGNYTVTLTAYADVNQQGVKHEESTDLSIEKRAVKAQFGYNSANPLSRTIRFTNNSENAKSFLWKFGDGKSSKEDNPTHTYESAGNYTVTLTAYADANQQGQKDEQMRSFSIEKPKDPIKPLKRTCKECGGTLSGEGDLCDNCKGGFSWVVFLGIVVFIVAILFVLKRVFSSKQSFMVCYRHEQKEIKLNQILDFSDFENCDFDLQLRIVEEKNQDDIDYKIQFRCLESGKSIPTVEQHLNNVRIAEDWGVSVETERITVDGESLKIKNNNDSIEGEE